MLVLRDCGGWRGRSELPQFIYIYTRYDLCVFGIQNRITNEKVRRRMIYLFAHLNRNRDQQQWQKQILHIMDHGRLNRIYAKMYFAYKGRHLEGSAWGNCGFAKGDRPQHPRAVRCSIEFH